MKMKKAKQIVSGLMAAAMIVSSVAVVPPTTASAATTVSAGNLQEGKNYIIVSKKSGKAMMVKDGSTSENANIVQQPINESNSAQIWTLDYDNNGYYQIVNKKSGMALDIPNSSKKEGEKIIQWGKGNGDNQKFKIEDVGNSYCRISPKISSGYALNVEGNKTNDGAYIIQWTYDGKDNEKWQFREVGGATSTVDPNAPMSARQAYDDFIKMFYYEEKDTGLGRIRNRASASKFKDFWKSAEMLEVMVDAYERFGDQKYEDIMSRFFDGFIDINGTNWKGNKFNDDIMWMVIASTRAYLLTGEQKYLDVALENFKLCYDRAASSDLGGGIWWTTDNAEKNACVNGPGSIAACYLGQATGDSSYYDKAISMMEWEYKTLFTTSGNDAGRVSDNIKTSGEISTWASTYNQGTFIGATTMLYEYTGNSKYLDWAKLAADYTIRKMGKPMSREANSNDEDLLGFKGILGRWLGYMARETGITTYDEWMQSNAEHAWKNRNSDGLMWSNFANQTAENIQEDTSQNSTKNCAAWECSSAVAWLLSSSTETVRNMPDPDMFMVEAEAGALAGSAKISNTNDASNKQYIGDVGGDGNGTVTITMNSDRARTVSMQIYYATSETRNLQVTANGTTVTDSCAGSSWTKANGAPSIVEVKLNAGVNTIVLGGANGAVAPNIDYVRFNLTDSEAQKTVSALIDVLPAVGAVKEEDESRVAAVTAAYNQLSNKGAVSNASKLTELTQRIADLKAGTVAPSPEVQAAQTALNTVVTEVKSLNAADYTADSWAALQTALTAAEKASADQAATVASLNAAKTALENAKKNLKAKEPETPPTETETPSTEKPGKTEAEKLAAAETQFLAVHNELTKLDSRLYTYESWMDVYHADLAALQEYNKENPDADTLQKLVDDLEKAKKKLVTLEAQKKAKAKLELDKELEADKNIYSEGQKDYTAESWKEFKEAYEAAVTVSSSASADTLKEQLTKLQNAKKALAKVPAEVKVDAPTIKSAKASTYKKGVQVKITINAVNGADKYEVYRVVSGKATLAGTTKSGQTTFKDTKVTKKNVEYYAVAVTADGKKSEAGSKAAVTLGAATKIKSVSKASNGIKITWKTDKKAKKYVVYRSTKKSSGYAKIASVKKSSSSYVDKKAKKGKKYYYKVVVVGKSQTSLMSKASKQIKR